MPAARADPGELPDATVVGVAGSCDGVDTTSGSNGGEVAVGVGRYAPGIGITLLAVLGWVCIVGRMLPDSGGKGELRLGLGLGMVNERAALGLGLRLLNRDEGLPRPLREVAVSSGLGCAATTVTAESSGEAKTVAALSRTEGTEYSSCSVALPRGIRCGLGGWPLLGGEGAMGSMSRSKIAEEDECTEVGEGGALGEREPSLFGVRFGLRVAPVTTWRSSPSETGER